MNTRVTLIRCCIAMFWLASTAYSLGGPGEVDPNSSKAEASQSNSPPAIKSEASVEYKKLVEQALADVAAVRRDSVQAASAEENGYVHEASAKKILATSKVFIEGSYVRAAACLDALANDSRVGVGPSMEDAKDLARRCKTALAGYGVSVHETAETILTSTWLRNMESCLDDLADKVVVAAAVAVPVNSSRKGILVKGLSLGMNLADVRRTLSARSLKPVVSAVDPVAGKVEVRVDGSGSCVITFGDDGLVDSFKLSDPDHFFNAGDMNAEDFAQQFIDAYHIPKLKAKMESPSSYWEYSSADGYRVRVDLDKSVSVSAIPAAAERHFGD
jgi:hypothetical protein